MSDLERLARFIVETLAAHDPARVYQPLALRELQEAIVPYRVARRALGIDTSEDYDLLLLRLAAGEAGLARTEPDDARTRFQVEVKNPHPNLDLVREQVDATIRLDVRAIEHATMTRHAAYGPADAPAPPVSMLEPAPVTAPPSAPAATAPIACMACSGALPTDRPANFCPHCGLRQVSGRCHECQGAVEAGWRFCAACGAAQLRR